MTLQGDAIGGPVAPIRDAATVILLRQADAGIETFMLCRHRRSAFLGGVHVFPGGKLDDDDMAESLVSRLRHVSLKEIANALGESIDEARAAGLLIAAVRETFEEAGVLLGSTNANANVEKAREELNGKSPFATIADKLELEIDGRRLQSYARWITPPIEKKRFDTRFFLAAVDTDQHASHDGNETTSAQWMAPKAALVAMRKDEIKLAPPTLRTLQWLGNFGTVQEAFADAASRPPPLVDPHVVMRKSDWILTLPGDPEHPTRERALQGPTRLRFVDGQWHDAT